MNFQRLHPGKWPVSVRVTALFALISGLWIFYSDLVLGWLVHDPPTLTVLSTLKGWFYVLIAAVFLFVLIQRNISRMEAILAEVVRQKEELQLSQFTIEKSTDMVLWVDFEARILYANRAATRQLGYSVEVLKTMKLTQFDGAHLEDDWGDSWTKLVCGSSLRLDWTLLCRDGRKVPVLCTADLIFFQGREFACVYLRDMTVERRAEDQFRHAQKMESVGTLAAGVAHDFNNILAGISGCSELLVKVVDDPEQARPLAWQIQASVRRAAQLVQGLLTFSREQKMHFRIVPLHVSLLAMQGFLSRLVGEGIRLQTRFCEGEPVVEVDPEPWEQVFLNLAVNARDAMAGRGELVISTQMNAGRVVVSVKDSGPGIDPGIGDRIFEPFFTTKPPGKGTGLGLSAVYGIVTQHRGTIQVRNSPEGGAEFLLSLPLKAEPTPPPVP